jgi:hypothetical protein
LRLLPFAYWLLTSGWFCSHSSTGPCTLELREVRLPALSEAAAWSQRLSQLASYH